MLTDTEFNQWCCRLHFSQHTQSLIEQIRSSEPSRRVGGGSKNVFGRYPSRKMGKTIQFESHKVELARVYELEHDENVLEYYDQPPPIKLNYQSQKGRSLAVIHTPDFFVIRIDSAGWEECKTEKELELLSKKNPNRYLKDEASKWRSPPGESFANKFNLHYQVYSDAYFNWILQRNLIFLEDYLRADKNIEPKKLQLVRDLVFSQPGIVLSDLLAMGKEALTEITSDDVYSLIATEQIYVQIFKHLLSESQNCPVFLNQDTYDAHQLMINTKPSPVLFSSGVITQQIGKTIIWDSKALTIVHVGQSEIILRGEAQALIQLKQEEFENLVRSGKIRFIVLENSNNTNQKAWERFTCASPEDQAEALRRYKIIEPYLQGSKRKNETTSDRTIRDWKRKYLIAQQNYGCGYIGLLSHRNNKGNRRRKLPEESITLMNQFITEDYETLKQKKMWEVYSRLLAACEEKGCIAPSYKTFTIQVQKRSSYELSLKRKGRRAAYSKESFYWELEKTTPRHGDRPWEIAHIDHTQLDVELVCSLTGVNLGRPWATFLVDAYSRRLVVVYLTFDSPSYRSCLMALRICVLNHGRLPQTVVTDNGAEFHSVYFETLLATFECTLKHRPAAKGRFGSVVERLFGTSNTQFVHNLMGNTQIMKQVRQVTKSINPKKQAIWTLSLLYEYLCTWAYEIYDTDDHPALGISPREAYLRGMEQSGYRNHRLIPYDDNFKILTLPTTSSGKAKVQPSQGIKINYIYYWSNSFRDPEIENTSIPVRYDPFDVSIAYAFVRGQWVQCLSQYYAEFQGRSEKEIRLATSELIKRKKNHQQNTKISARKLANFLESIETQEVLLEQHLHDTENKAVFQLIEGGKTQFIKEEVRPKLESESTDFFTPIKDVVSTTTTTDIEQLVIYEEF